MKVYGCISSYSLAGRGNTCNLCGIVILASHIARHKAVHRGEAGVDERSVSGGFFCDLCGLMFRQHFNLLKHWRTGCPEIQVNLYGINIFLIVKFKQERTV